MQKNSDAIPVKTQNDEETSLVSTLTAPIRNICWKFAKCMRIDAVCEGQFLRKGSSSNRPDI